MDALSDVLTLLKPQAYLGACLDVGGNWAIRFNSGPDTIKCYAVTAGSCWLAVGGVQEPVRLEAGDCFIILSGRTFTLCNDLALTPASASEILGRARVGETVIVGDGGEAAFAGARFEVDRRHAATLLGALPPLMHLPAATGQVTLRWSIELMLAELRGGGPGASLAAHHLAHLMLLQALRLHLSRPAREQAGWLHALGDPQIGRAMEAMHADPAHRWTLGTLASRAGLSRSIFARRFRDEVGTTPITYLTRWRMMLAADRLTGGRESLAAVAQHVGYGSENTFNTAFARVMGCSPRRYARRHTDGKLSECRSQPLSRRFG